MTVSEQNSPYWDVYLATSWQNAYFRQICDYLHDFHGIDVYNFQATNSEFHWSDILETMGLKFFDPCLFQRVIQSDVCAEAYAKDVQAVQYSKALVMLQPCGRTAHLELGMALAYGKPCVIYYDEWESRAEPDLMVYPADIVIGKKQLSEWCTHVLEKPNVFAEYPHSACETKLVDTSRPNVECRE